MVIGVKVCWMQCEALKGRNKNLTLTLSREERENARIQSPEGAKLL
jgi:hypothetical protein